MTGLPLAAILEAAEREAYRAALTRNAGSITDAACELGVSRVTASRAVERLGLRVWLDGTWAHRDPATVGRRGDRRKRTALCQACMEIRATGHADANGIPHTCH